MPSEETAIVTEPVSQGGNERKLVEGFDLLKIAMAVLIVDMHAGVSGCLSGYGLKGTLDWINELAVPVFFLLSSWFFFAGLRGTAARDGLRKLARREWRVARLYIFWTVALGYWVVTLWHPEYMWFSALTPLVVVKKFLLGGQFGGGWFFGALLVGVPVVYGLYRLLGRRGVWVLPLAVYIFLFIGGGNEGFYAWYSRVVSTRPDLSFPAGLLWIALGCVLGCGNGRAVMERTPVWVSVPVFLVSAVFGCVIEQAGWVFRIPAVVALVFASYRMTGAGVALCRHLRAVSVHVFCLHYTVIRLLEGVIGNSLLLFVAALAVSWLISECIIALSQVRGFGWLKYSM